MRLWTNIISLIKRLKLLFPGDNFIYVACVVVGFLSGFAAILLKLMVFWVHKIVTEHLSQGIDILFILMPLVGIVISAFIIKYAYKGNIGKGIGNVLYEIAQKAGFVKRHKMFSHLITSAITVGFGGSAGLESPIVVTGAAIGSNFSRLFRLMYKERTVLLAAGAAAGISSAFSAPITGVIFAAEVLLTGVTTFAFIPIILASVCGALCSKIALHQDVLFQFHLQETFNYLNVPYYIILGVLTGFFSIYYIRFTHKIESFFARLNNRWLLQALAAGLLLSAMCLIFPSLFGEGYSSIKLLADGNASKLTEHSFFETFINNEWLLLLFVAVVAIVKVFATSVTLSGGGNGGNFAPTLFAGAFIGFFVSRFINLLQFSRVPESNFTLVGMSGVLSGVMLAPLTGIFLIAEITGGYELMIPLMLVSSISYVIVRYFERYSLDTKKLALSGKIFTDNKDRNILGNLNIKNSIDKDYRKIDPELTLRTLVDVVKRTHRNFIVVVGAHDEFLGLIDMSTTKDFLFNESLYDSIIVRDLMKKPQAVVDIKSSMEDALEILDRSKSWHLPVVNQNKFVGYISKSTILQAYRGELIRQAGLI